jgi:ParB-like chromosome segregation protein Spo0J
MIDCEVRFEAAKLLGLDVVPCVRIDHLYPDEQRVHRLAVNRRAENGERDLNKSKTRVRDRNAPRDLHVTMLAADAWRGGDLPRELRHKPSYSSPIPLYAGQLPTFS